MKKILRYSFRTILFVLALIVIGLAFVKIRYGLGKTYPDIGAENPAGNARLEKLIKLDYRFAIDFLIALPF